MTMMAGLATCAARSSAASRSSRVTIERWSERVALQITAAGVVPPRPPPSSPRWIY
jgi:hypothetical protein